MYVFDLFEGHEERKDAPQAAANQSSDQRGVTKGVRGDIYNNTNIAGVRRAIDQAIASEPGAKSEIEAIVSYLDKQAQTNAEQEREIDRLEREEERLRKTQDDLTKDLQDKEARFREITAQLAAGKIDQQQAAKMAQDVEAGKAPEVPAARPAQAAPAAQAEPAQAQRPALRAVPSGAQPVAAQPAEPAAAQPAQAPAKDAGSRAFGQMAQQLTPGRVIKGKNQQAQQTAQPTQTTTAEPPLAANDAGNVRNLLRVAESITEQQPGQILSIPKNNTPEEIAQANLDNISLMAVAGKPVKLYFSDGQGPTLPYPQLKALFDYLKVLNPRDADTKSRVINLLSNSRFFYEYMLNNIVGQTHVNPVPKGQPVPDETPGEPVQGKLLEGDVIRLANVPQASENLKAYNLALEIIKAARDPRISTAKVDQMKQFLFKDYQARVQQAPDGSFYLNRNGVKSRLPSADFPLEEEPHDGKNAFSDGQGQWSSENNQISSGNNPHGFSEAEVSKDKTGARMYQAKEKFLLSRDGKQIAFYDNMIQAQRDAERMQNELGGQVVVQRVMREQDVAENMPRDSIQRYLAIDAEDDVAAVKAAIHAISKDPELKPTAKARLLGQVGMIIKTHRLPIGRAYYEFMQQFMEATKVREADSKMDKVFKGHRIEVEYPEGRGRSHIYHRQEPMDLKGIFSDANSAAARNPRATINLFVNDEYIPNYEWQDGVEMPAQGIGEAMTDYQKRRQRERDVDMGKPVKPLPKNPKTDYQKKREQERRDMELGESHMKDLFYKAQEDLKNLTDAQFIKTHGMSKVAFQQQYRTLLKPAAQQDVPVAESKNYWHQLQEERRRKANTYVSELENALKDIE